MTKHSKRNQTRKTVMNNSNANRTDPKGKAPWQPLAKDNNNPKSSQKYAFLSEPDKDKEERMPFLEPVFLWNSACPYKVTNLDILEAAQRACFANVLVAAQRFGQLWLLYPTTMENRAWLLTKKLSIGNKRNIDLYSKNPSSLVNDYGQPLPQTKLIDYAPCPWPHREITEALIKMGVKTKSQMRFEPLRGRDNASTPWLSCRRFIYIDIQPHIQDYIVLRET